MPLAFAESLSTGSYIFLIVALGLALSFEFVNGFHDTANAVATVIYTHTLPPWIAVIWSGLCNLTGVLVSSGTVAYSILALLPVELVLNVGSGAGFAMIFALLISAILWNLGTWYLGLPASSSHTLIGSILGVGLANAVMAGHSLMQGLNWEQVYKVFLSLLISPIVGFVCAGLLLLVLKALVKDKKLFEPPPKDAPPPWWIRGTLMLTCTGVSFAHGSNDGQKGMGLLLLILIGILPAEYALNLNAKSDDLLKLQTTAAQVQPILETHATAAAADPSLQEKVAQETPPTGGMVKAATDQKGLMSTGPAQEQHGQAVNDAGELSQYLETGGKLTSHTFSAVAAANRELIDMLNGKQKLDQVAPADRKTLRTDLFLVDQTLSKLNKTHQITAASEQKIFADYHKQLDATTKYLPTWIKVAVAMALGLGTMIGWKRIVVTVGEKIGKEHLNYGQGMAAELVAMITIGAADKFGMPVSTTHVLSSGVAGTMAANKSGLQAATLRNVLLAWVLTLPVCVLLGAATFSAGLYIVFNHLVPQATAICMAIALLIIARRIWIWMSQSRQTAIAA
ncbi:MAG: inorganic phosphate transporter, partial [Phycisphaerae bacterium]|nr:inorganic phosphate transporter [Phycisphaerae bacterium]